MFLQTTISEPANATYDAIYLSDKYVIIGVDSRQTERDGQHQDDTCKIALANTGIAYSFIGPRGILGLGIDFFDLLKAATMETKTPREAADRFADTALQSANTIPREARASIDVRQVVGVFLTAGTDRTEAVLGFVSQNERTLEFKKHIWANFPLDDVKGLNDFGKTEHLRGGLFSKDQDVTQNAEDMKTLVSRIIDAKISDNIGGHPTVLVLEAGKRPYWHSRVPSCPSLE
jgi:hypothetical protein